MADSIDVREGFIEGSLSVLIADDDQDDRLLLREASGEIGWADAISFVRDGESLMDYLKRRGEFADSPGYPMPRLIILDLNMPKKSGLEVLREIKADPELRRIPVVIIATSEEKEEIYESYSLGANSFISKPMTYQGWQELVKSLFRYWFEIVDLPGPA